MVRSQLSVVRKRIAPRAERKAYIQFPFPMPYALCPMPYALYSMLYLDAKKVSNEKGQSFSQHRVGIVPGCHFVVVIYHAVPSLR